MDVTDRKKVEQELEQKARDLSHTLQELQWAQAKLIQSEKMSSLGQLVAGIAHEINNPVNFIYGNLTHLVTYVRDLLEVLETYQQHYPEPVDAVREARENLDIDFALQDLPNLVSSMKSGSVRIREIVASLRVFSRLDEAEFKLAKIHEGIDSNLTILQSRLAGNSDRLQIEIIKEYGDLPLIECYAGDLNQVFMHVLTNAIDAIDTRCKQEKWQGQISIKTEAMSPDAKIKIGIADNGMGMSEKVKERIFDPFFTTKAVGRGTGLGMSISYQIIVEKHQGNIYCISAPGEGTTVYLEIPARMTHQKINT